MLLRFGKIIFWIYYHLFYRLRVVGWENVPKAGGVILCSNHISYNDPIVLCLVSKRVVHMVAKKQLFTNRFFGFLLRKLNAIPVNREKADMATYKAVTKVLLDGGVVGIFSQGTRMKDFDSKDAKAGVALFAMKGSADVVPVYIDTTYRFFSRITVRFGKPVDLEAYRGVKLKTEGLAEAADKIMGEIGKLAEKGA